MVVNNTEYFINQLKENPVNLNQYIYIDSVDGDLQVKGNKWFFSLNFYLIMDAYLPMNMFNTSLQLPFASLEDTSINLNNKIPVPSWITQPELCKTYSTSFVIDTSDSAFFNQQLTNYQMYMSHIFDYDANVVNSNTIKAESGVIEKTLNEWTDINQVITFLYTNYLILNDDQGWFDNGTNYYLNNKSGSYVEQAPVYYMLDNDCEDIKKPIKHLLQFTNSSAMAITYIKLTFNYSVGTNTEIKKLEWTDTNTYYVNGIYNLYFKGRTTYDMNKHEVILSIDGQEGFYIPEDAFGYCTIQVKINQSENVKQYVFTRSFSFLGSSYDDVFINIKPIFIQNPAVGFKRMAF